MKGKPRAPSNDSAETDFPADSPEYLARWARELVKTGGKKQARLALAEYQRLATDKAVPQAERKAAAERAKALEKRI